MSTWFTNFLLLLLLAITDSMSCEEELQVVRKAQAGVLQAIQWARASPNQLGFDHNSSYLGVALEDCVKLYGDAEPRLARMVSGESFSSEDALTWLSGALASHMTCLDGLDLVGKGLSETLVAHNLTVLLREALAFYGPKTNLKIKVRRRWNGRHNRGLLATWNAATSRADFVVAKDGSGNFNTINAAVAALARMGLRRPAERVIIIYVKSGVYNERVEIGRNMKNVMFVGDGVDQTVVTGNQNVLDGSTTLNSATFGVSGDGFWARDMTFENTAGPQKRQAVALRVSSDLSVFYRCSIKGYQDTLFVHSLRQFYRDCHIYGTIDFIFGDAPVVFQNCDIFVKRPLNHQSNMITAQGRDDPNENTGISILNSRIKPGPDFVAVKGRFKSYLGRPWRKYSRTLFLKTELDGLIDPKGWTEWRGNFALSTLYYGEFMN